MIVEKKYRTENGQSIVVLYVEGLIVLGKSALFFGAALRNVLVEYRVVIDLTKIDFIDSTGIGELIAICAVLAGNRKLALVNVSERILKLIQLANLGGRFDIFLDEDEAIASLVKFDGLVDSKEHPLPASAIAPLPGDNDVSAAPQLLPSHSQPPPSVVDRRLSVFVCHASDDKARVRLICQELNVRGVDVWFDEDKLLPGQDWRYEIGRALRTADAVIVCLSAKALRKTGYIQKEIREALEIADHQPEGTIFLIPAKLEPCDVPERLARWHWVDLHGAGGLSRLIKALNARAAYVGVAALDADVS